VGVVNATPDSFSDGGRRRSPSQWIEHALACYEAGAAIVEVGGESNVSNRPAVSAAIETERILPVVESLVAIGAPVAIDTHKTETAAAALAAGASIVNDISGLGDPGMIELCADNEAGVVVMHTATPPKTPLWDDELYPEGVVDHLADFFEERLATLAVAGISRERIVIDPGPDFAKTPSQTVAALRHLDRLAGFDCPIMLAISRKDFIGALTGRKPRQRAAGTYAALASGLARGGRLLRVHDVEGTIDFLRVWEALEGETDVPIDLRIGSDIRRDQSPRSPDPA
jgi:dihydropteroate synthase